MTTAQLPQRGPRPVVGMVFPPSSCARKHVTAHALMSDAYALAYPQKGEIQ